MSDIVLATLNAKYIHAAFGLRYLVANLGRLRQRARLLEFDLTVRPSDVVEVLLAESPSIIGLGVYIWNVASATEIVTLLKRLRPDVTVVLGGPEVSYETDSQEIVRQADYVIAGEADLEFARLCERLIAGERPAPKVIRAEAPDLARLALPYDLYDDADLIHRFTYVEISRGCPFGCEFCLSSLDAAVRQFPLPPLLASLERLIERGARRFKFVDRSFNCDRNRAASILDFFLGHYTTGMFVHLEMVPDRLDETLRGLIQRFPPGALQLEIGVQSFDQTVLGRIGRRQDLARLGDNFRFLLERTGTRLHADLIAGLPGESLDSFGQSFDRLVALGPQEIQVGILKRLRGAPITRHDQEWEMRYNPFPPYEILQNKLIDFSAFQRLRRFARYWEIAHNSGEFAETVSWLWTAAPARESSATVPREAPASAFSAFMKFSEWLYARVGRRHAIALPRLLEFMFLYLTEEQGREPAAVARALLRDFQRGGRREIPPFLRPHLK